MAFMCVARVRDPFVGECGVRRALYLGAGRADLVAALGSAVCAGGVGRVAAAARHAARHGAIRYGTGNNRNRTAPTPMWG